MGSHGCWDSSDTSCMYGGGTPLSWRRLPDGPVSLETATRPYTERRDLSEFSFSYLALAIRDEHHPRGARIRSKVARKFRFLGIGEIRRATESGYGDARNSFLEMSETLLGVIAATVSLGHHVLTTMLAHFFLWHLKIRLEKTPALIVSQVQVLLAVVLPIRTNTIDTVLALVAWVQQRNHNCLSHTPKTA